MIPRHRLPTRMNSRAGAIPASRLALVLAAAGCGGGVLDVGRDRPPSPLPVDERNPIILDNDAWHDNWQGEYAMLLANKGTTRLLAIIASNSRYHPYANDNATGWTNMLTAARQSGLKNIPDITTSPGPALVRPSDGVIESTVANNSAGANLIVQLSRQYGLTYRPVVVVTGAALTTVADAYLLDKTVADRVVVVSALGSYADPNGVMNGPNGDLDPWADWIVAQRLRYVQISGFYNQFEDVSETEVAALPHREARNGALQRSADRGQAARHLQVPRGVGPGVGVVRGAAGIRQSGPADSARYGDVLRRHAGATVAAGCRREYLDRVEDCRPAGQLHVVAVVAGAGNVFSLTEPTGELAAEFADAPDFVTNGGLRRHLAECPAPESAIAAHFCRRCGHWETVFLEAFPAVACISSDKTPS